LGGNAWQKTTSICGRRGREHGNQQTSKLVAGKERGLRVTDFSKGQAINWGPENPKKKRGITKADKAQLLRRALLTEMVSGQTFKHLIKNGQ